MGFHRKHSSVAALDSDVLVISECASRDRLDLKGLMLSPDSYVWVGDNKDKGLAVVVKPPYKVRPLFEPKAALPIWAMPVRITTPLGQKVDLIAVWSFWYRDKRNETGNPIVVALERFAKDLNMGNLIVAGDFNNSVIWDRGKKSSNHRLTSEALAASGLVSVYHSLGAHEYGSEPHPTIYWRDRKIDGPRYHIDYVYAPKRWLDKDVTVQVGEFSPWVQLSDHVPLTVNFGAVK